MPDSTDGGQGGATVDKARFDGLMSAYQKALGENRRLGGTAGQDAQAQNGSGGNADSQDSQPANQWDPGQMLEVNDDGEIVDTSRIAGPSLRPPRGGPPRR